MADALVRNPLRAVIVDDEYHCIETLQWDIKTYAPQCRVIATFSDARKAIEGLTSLDPDVLFLDIEMPHHNGFELLSSLPQLKSHVIFTTAYSQYAVKAFRHSAVDYLLKPVDGDELAKALSKIAVDDHRPLDSHGLKVLSESILGEHRSASKLSLPTAEGWELIDILDIVHCESDGSYSNIYFRNGNRLTISRNLKQLEEALSGYGFQRVHHRHLVSIACIKRILRSGTLEMIDGSEVVISRGKKEALLRLIQ